MEEAFPMLFGIAVLWYLGYKLTRPRARRSRKFADPGCPYCRGTGRVLDYSREMSVMCGCVTGEVQRRLSGRPPTYEQRANMKPRRPDPVDPGPPSAQRVPRSTPAQKSKPAAAVEQCEKCGFYSCRCART